MDSDTAVVSSRRRGLLWYLDPTDALFMRMYTAMLSAGAAALVVVMLTAR